MKAIFCDRCGKQIRTAFVRDIIPGIKASYTGFDNVRYDLCFDCMSEFKKWIGGGVENEKDVL